MTLTPSQVRQACVTAVEGLFLDSEGVILCGDTLNVVIAKLEAMPIAADAKTPREAVMEKALAFYADPMKWSVDGTFYGADPADDRRCAYGDVARAALAFLPLEPEGKAGADTLSDLMEAMDGAKYAEPINDHARSFNSGIDAAINELRVFYEFDGRALSASPPGRVEITGPEYETFSPKLSPECRAELERLRTQGARADLSNILTGAPDAVERSPAVAAAQLTSNNPDGFIERQRSPEKIAVDALERLAAGEGIYVIDGEYKTPQQIAKLALSAIRGGE